MRINKLGDAADYIIDALWILMTLKKIECIEIHFEEKPFFFLENVRW